VPEWGGPFQSPVEELAQSELAFVFGAVVIDTEQAQVAAGV